MTPLRQRMLEDMSIRNLTDNTKLSYVQQVSLFAKYFHRSPEKLGPQEVREYQVYLTLNRKLSASSIGTACAAPSSRIFSATSPTPLASTLGAPIPAL